MPSTQPRQKTNMKNNYVKSKRNIIKSQKLKPLLRSKISLENKTQIYKQTLRPAMTYGIQRGTLKNSNLTRFHLFQSITLHVLFRAPWYVTSAIILYATISIYQQYLILLPIRIKNFIKTPSTTQTLAVSSNVNSHVIF